MRFGWLRRARFLLLIVLCALWAPLPVLALEIVTIPENVGALDLSKAVQVRKGNQGRVQLSTAPDAQGIVRRIEVQAIEQNTNPNWGLIALTNTSDVQLDRLLVAPHFRMPGSGVFTPDLGGARVDVITPSQGFRLDRVDNREADVFALTIDPGATITLVMELESEALPELYLWQPQAYADYVNSFTLFRGTLLGIASLMAVFLTIMFAVKGRGMFPAVAAFAWAVLFYLLVDFGLLGALLELTPEQLRTSRAAVEAALATTLFGYLFIYLNLHRWHLRFIHLALAIAIVLAALMVLSFFQPVITIALARGILAMVGLFGIVMVVFLAIRGYDRAIMIVPTWVIVVAWLIFAYLVLSGHVSNDIAQPAVAGGLVLIVMLLGFSALQHAFTDGQVVAGHISSIERRALAQQGSGDYVFDWNVERDRLNISNDLATRLGAKDGALRGGIKAWQDLVHAEDRERFRTGLDTLIELKRGKVSSEFRLLTHDGSYRHFHLRVKPVIGGSGEVLRCVGALQDVSLERATRERLMHDAVNDSLSGLPNKALFLDRLERALMRSREAKANKPAVFLVDLDGFANLADRIGHISADSVLLAIARRLSRLMRPLDTIARINNDQFAVILVSEQDASKIAGFAEQLRKSIREPIKFGESELSISASIGVTIYDNKPNKASGILRDAELAMMAAKRLGGDRIEAWRANNTQLNVTSETLNDELERAIAHRELEINFQPIFDLESGQLSGAEALVRWNHPNRGAISPEEFIPLAERSGLIDRLGQIVIEQTAHHLNGWLREKHVPEGFFVSLNLSAQQLASDSLLTEMRTLVAGHKNLVKHLVLEVTESQVMTSPEYSAYILDALKGMGFRLALDDFGVGHSSFAYLHRFSFDFIKIPSTFVQTDQKNGIEFTQMPIMKAIVGLAKDLDLQIIAEGAENETEVERLKSLRCGLAQGYAFSKPLTVDKMQQFLKKNS